MTIEERVKEHFIEEKKEIDTLARLDDMAVARALNIDDSKTIDGDEAMAILEKRLVAKGTI